MSGRGSGIAGNPVLIGAATTLVIIVAVFLAYNANAGLPFVPTYSLNVETPSAANLVRGNDVRIGGARVGAVSSITVKKAPGGRDVAVLGLKMERDVAPLPDDSRFLIRTRSALGLKYVEITRGDSNTGFQDGATVPEAASRPQPVEIDEVFNMFDDATRRSIQRNLKEFGDALAGRGENINTAIGEADPLLRDVIPVARNLSDRRTGLTRLVRALGRTAEEVAPVAETQASLFRNLDTTFTALDEVARPFIQDSISGGPPALEAGIEGFPQQRPFLVNSTALFDELEPGVEEFASAAPALADATAVGTPVLRRSPAFNRDLSELLGSVQEFAKDPLVPQGLRSLTGVLNALQPTLEYVTPAQTTCNYLTLWFRNIASLLSDGGPTGTWQRFIIIATPLGPNSEGFPSSAPANGPTVENHLHSNPYPNTAAPGQPKECEAGNERYIAGKTTIGNVPGTQSDKTEITKVPGG